MMEVIESTELGAAALQPQRPWVVMSALGLSLLVFRAIFTSKRAGAP